MTDQAKGLLITLCGVLFVVPDALFVRLIDAPPLTIAYFRVTLVGLVIALGLLLTQGLRPFRAAAGTGINGLIYAFGVGSSGVLFVIAVSLTSVANVVFIIASLPVFAAVFSRICPDRGRCCCGGLVHLKPMGAAAAVGLSGALRRDPRECSGQKKEARIKYRATACGHQVSRNSLRA